MKLYNINKFAKEQGGEYVLGMKDLHTHACYLIYGTLEPREDSRLVKPGDGHEEILLAVDGRLIIESEKGKTVLEPGHATHVKEEEAFFISNPSEKTVIYVLAGGHSQPHH
ncbi:MAG: hypothetical protein M0T73_17465 [Deltaproteobacteria bacterium]|nr:hypothetical protein [Deltaproteobacteria bacterium]